MRYNSAYSSCQSLCVYGCAVLCAVLSAACTRDSELMQITADVCRVQQQGGVLPDLEKHFPGLDEEGAYKLQSQCVQRARKSGERLIGYKAGLTAAGQYEAFGLSREALGVLFASAELQAQPDGVYRLPVRPYIRPMIELEIALRFGTDIQAPLPDLDALYRSLDGMTAAVELPDLGFAVTGLPSGTQLIASNVAAYRFILGPFHTPTPTPIPASADAEHPVMRLSRDGVQISTMDDPALLAYHLQMALRLVNRLVAEGQPPRQGQILLTGSLGKMQVAWPGKYQADFEPWGSIHFLVPQYPL